MAKKHTSKKQTVRKRRNPSVLTSGQLLYQLATFSEPAKPKNDYAEFIQQSEQHTGHVEVDSTPKRLPSTGNPVVDLIIEVGQAILKKGF
jgi:hypothetical protein